jgi:hypothetical protein
MWGEVPVAGDGVASWDEIEEKTGTSDRLLAGPAARSRREFSSPHEKSPERLYRAHTKRIKALKQQIEVATNINNTAAIASLNKQLGELEGGEEY